VLATRIPVTGLAASVGSVDKGVQEATMRHLKPVIRALAVVLVGLCMERWCSGSRLASYA
jgi:hypothetical protein